MTPDQLAAIEARHAASAKGPWQWVIEDTSMLRLTTNDQQADEDVLVVAACKSCAKVDAAAFNPSRHCVWPQESDAAFLAASWQDIKDLLDEVKRLRAEVVDAYRQGMNDYMASRLKENDVPDTTYTEQDEARRQELIALRWSRNLVIPEQRELFDLQRRADKRLAEELKPTMDYLDSVNREQPHA